MAEREKTRTDLPDQGDRTSRSRRGGSSVPATPVSSSHDGRLEECTAGSSNYSASAKSADDDYDRPVRKRGRAHPRPDLPRVDSEESIRSVGSYISTESLEASLPETSDVEMVSSGNETGLPPLSTEEGIAAYVAEKMAKETERRGRPPTSGKYVGLGRARDALRKARLEEKERALEEDRRRAYAAATKRRSDSEASGRSTDTESVKRLRRTFLREGGDDVEIACETRTTLDLIDLIYKAVNVCDEVAGRAKRLKGTDVKALRTAGRDGRRVADTLYVRLKGDPAAKVAQALPQVYTQNEELKREVRRLQEEVIELTAKLSMPPPPPPLPPAPKGKSEDALLERIGTLIDAKLAALNLPVRKAGRAGSGTRGGSRGASASRGGSHGGSGADAGAGAKARAGTGSSVLRGRAKKGSAPTAPAGNRGAAPGPSSSAGRGKEPWSKVVGRKARRAAGQAASAAPSRPSNDGPTPGPDGARRPPAPPKKKKSRARLRVPRSAAITVSADPAHAGDRPSIAEAIKRCRNSIPLSSVGIDHLQPRRTLTGDLMVEVFGDSKEEKADALAGRMREVLRGTGYVIRRPARKGDLRVSGFDDSVTVEELVSALASVGECREAEYRLGEIRTMPSGLRSVWVQCPVASAKKLATARTVRVGWVLARVEALKPRPLRCYRCLRPGHTGRYCPSAEPDRGGRCYRCGLEGHQLRQCTAAEPKCPLCKDLGRPSRHVLGGPSCRPPPGVAGGLATTFHPPRELATGVTSKRKRPSSQSEEGGASTSAGDKEIPLPPRRPEEHESVPMDSEPSETVEVGLPPREVPTPPITPSPGSKEGVAPPSGVGGTCPPSLKEAPPSPSLQREMKTATPPEAVKPSKNLDPSRALAALLGHAGSTKGKVRPGPASSKPKLG